MRLVICEKPSQAQAYAKVLGANERKDGYFIGNGYIIAYCFGHLLELAAPEDYNPKYAKWRYSDLPIIPPVWKHIPVKGKEYQLEILKSLINRPDVEYVVNACDAGREGELIFRLVYEYAKSAKKTYRLWIASMEDVAILTGFSNLKDGADYDSLYAVASCRERADWCLGLNVSRLMTVLYGTT
jgi:DNA topoisomerase-3